MTTDEVRAQVEEMSAFDLGCLVLNTAWIDPADPDRVRLAVVELVRRAQGDGGRDEPDNAPLPPGVEGFAPGRPG